MPGTFDTVHQLLATIKRTVGLSNFSFREIKSSGKIEIVVGKYEELRFQVMKFQALSVSRASLTEEEHTLGTKWTQLQTN